MRTSHWIVAVAGFIACVVLATCGRDELDRLGAETADDHRKLLVYTPHVAPGDRVEVKIELKGGDRIRVEKVEATLDGNAMKTESVQMEHSTEGRRFPIGVARVELAAIVPPATALGDHTLRLVVASSCEGPQFAPPCRGTSFDVPLTVSSGIGARVFELLKALLAAIVSFGVARVGRRPVGAWIAEVEDTNKQAAKSLGAAAIALIYVWGSIGYPLFAKPLAAAFGASSTVFIVGTMILWAAIPVAGARFRPSRRIPEPVVMGPDPSAIVRFTAPKDGGYRGGTIAQHDLDAVARAIRDTYGLRFRRRGGRLVPRWWKSAPVTFVGREGGFEMTGSRDHHVLFAVVAAKKLGPLDLEIEQRTVRVDETSTPESVARELREQGVPA